MASLQAFSSKKLCVKHFRFFKSDCFMHVPNANKTKWDPKSKKCIFLGYSEEAKGYRLFNYVIKMVLVSHDVIFLEQLYQMEEASFLDN